jgi:hypothetical protein
MAGDDDDDELLPGELLYDVEFELPKEPRSGSMVAMTLWPRRSSRPCPLRRRCTSVEGRAHVIFGDGADRHPALGLYCSPLVAIAVHMASRSARHSPSPVDFR